MFFRFRSVLGFIVQFVFFQLVRFWCGFDVLWLAHVSFDVVVFGVVSYLVQVMAHLRPNHGDGIMVCPSAKRSLSDEDDGEEAWEPPPPLVGLDPGSHHGSRCRIAVGVLPWEPPPLGEDLAPYWREHLARSAHAAAKQEEAQRLYKHEGAKVEQRSLSSRLLQHLMATRRKRWQHWKGCRS